MPPQSEFAQRPALIASGRMGCVLRGTGHHTCSQTHDLGRGRVTGIAPLAFPRAVCSTRCLWCAIPVPRQALHLSEPQFPYIYKYLQKHLSLPTTVGGWPKEGCWGLCSTGMTGTLMCHGAEVRVVCWHMDGSPHSGWGSAVLTSGSHYLSCVVDVHSSLDL